MRRKAFENLKMCAIWIANYDMPSMKMGKCWKFKKDHIDAWLAKGGPEKSRKNFNKE